MWKNGKWQVWDSETLNNGKHEQLKNGTDWRQNKSGKFKLGKIENVGNTVKWKNADGNNRETTNMENSNMENLKMLETLNNGTIEQWTN